MLSNMTTQQASSMAYLRTRVMSATQEELRLMLLDGAIKFARQGRDGLAKKDYEASYNGFTQARSIVLELINSMRPEVAPELCQKLSSLYTFIYTEMIEASLEKDVSRADEAIRLLEYERETWLLLMEQQACEQQSRSDQIQPGPVSLEQTPERALPPADAPDTDRPYRPFSAEG